MDARVWTVTCRERGILGVGRTSSTALNEAWTAGQLSPDQYVQLFMTPNERSEYDGCTVEQVAIAPAAAVPVFGAARRYCDAEQVWRVGQETDNQDVQRAAEMASFLALDDLLDAMEAYHQRPPDAFR